MNLNKFKKIEQLIEKKKIEQAEIELKNLGQDYSKDPYYLFLRGKIFYLKKLYYISIDTFLIVLEFKDIDEVYDILSNIYQELGNYELSKDLSNRNTRIKAVNELKDSMTGIYRIK